MLRPHPLELEQLYINGGKRGYILRLHSADLERLLLPQRVEVAA